MCSRPPDARNRRLHDRRSPSGNVVIDSSHCCSPVVTCTIVRVCYEVTRYPAVLVCRVAKIAKQAVRASTCSPAEVMQVERYNAGKRCSPARLCILAVAVPRSLAQLSRVKLQGSEEEGPLGWKGRTNADLRPVRHACRHDLSIQPTIPKGLLPSGNRTLLLDTAWCRPKSLMLGRRRFYTARVSTFSPCTNQW